MNTHADPVSLPGFESRLLGELRRVVAEDSLAGAAMPARRGARRPLTPRRLALGGAVAATLAVAAVAGLSIGGGSEPAYAVDTNANGTVTVTINSLTDAAGLQRELADAGVRALVQYVPEGKRCAGPFPAAGQKIPGPSPAAIQKAKHAGEAGTEVRKGPPPGPLGPDTGKLGPNAGDEAGGPPGGALGDTLNLKRTNGGVTFTVSSDQRPGQTLLIRTQIVHGQSQGGPTVEGALISVASVDGPAHPCALVDAP